MNTVPFSEQVRQCIRCVLGTGDRAELTFDQEGVCNHCRFYDRQVAELPATAAERESAFVLAVARIRELGVGRPYDCVLGLSGGVDSSYLAWLTKREGLRPLVVHLDNGWNSELAVSNIEKIVGTLEYDLRTHVIDWREFRDLQLAYLRASVVDIEVLTDHAISAVLMRVALENDIRFVLSGHNVATEGVLPYSWTYRKSDHINIQDINRRFGKGTLRTYPFLHGILKRHVQKAGIESVSLLNYVPYDQASVKKLLETELGWRDYGGKHFESIFTRFYQSSILPQKFGIDKRKAHFSSLICSGQMTRDAALEQLASPPDTPERIQSDRTYVIKKLGITVAEFESLMQLPVRSHFDFETEGGFFARYPYLRPLRFIWMHLKPMIMDNQMRNHARRARVPETT